MKTSLYIFFTKNLYGDCMIFCIFVSCCLPSLIYICTLRPVFLISTPVELWFWQCKKLTWRSLQSHGIEPGWWLEIRMLDMDLGPPRTESTLCPRNLLGSQYCQEFWENMPFSGEWIGYYWTGDGYSHAVRGLTCSYLHTKPLLRNRAFSPKASWQPGFYRPGDCCAGMQFSRSRERWQLHLPCK